MPPGNSSSSSMTVRFTKCTPPCAPILGPFTATVTGNRSSSAPGIHIFVAVFSKSMLEMSSTVPRADFPRIIRPGPEPPLAEQPLILMVPLTFGDIC
jgi:hypothetical protein